MDSSKDKPPLVLLAASLFVLVVMRMALEAITGGRNISLTSGGPRQRRQFATNSPKEGTSGVPHTASASTREQRIRERAFQIWLDEGKPQGRQHEHWRRADAEIASDTA
jgi:hypothetical protein